MRDTVIAQITVSPVNMPSLNSLRKIESQSVGAFVVKINDDH